LSRRDLKQHDKDAEKHGVEYIQYESVKLNGSIRFNTD